MLMRRSNHNRIVSNLTDRCDALQADLNWWAERCVQYANEQTQMRETIAEQELVVIEELRARLARFQRKRGAAGRFTRRAAQ